MSSSSKHDNETISRRAPGHIHSEGSISPIENDDGTPRMPLTLRNLASHNSQFQFQNNYHNIPAFLAVGDGPASHYSAPGSEPPAHRVHEYNPDGSPPIASITLRRCGSLQPTPAVTPDIQRVDSCKIIRRRPMSSKHIRYVSAYPPKLVTVFAQGGTGTTNRARLLPALPIAGSPGTPTLIPGAKELFNPSDGSSVDSDAESASPGSEHRPTLLRRGAKKLTEGKEEKEEKPHPPILYKGRRHQTPENLHPPYARRRPGKKDDSSSSPPVRRVFLPREPTPTFS